MNKYKVIYFYTNNIKEEAKFKTLEAAKQEYLKLLKQFSDINKLYIYNQDVDITDNIYNEYIINNLI